MKYAISLLLIIIAFQIAIGQVAIIQDPDGWTNVRKEPNGQSEIIHKIFENEVFWFDYEETDEIQDWVSIFIPKNKFSLGKSEPYFITGFIHKTRLLPLENLQKNTGDDLIFRYELTSFNPTNRIIEKKDSKWIVAIDGRPVWGADGELPKVEVKDVAVKIKGIRIDIHKAFYSDIYECTNAFSVYKKGETYFVYQWNSDGAGAYQIVWVLDKNGLQQRMVGSMY